MYPSESDGEEPGENPAGGLSHLERPYRKGLGREESQRLPDSQMRQEDRAENIMSPSQVPPTLQSNWVLTKLGFVHYKG